MIRLWKIFSTESPALLYVSPSHPCQFIFGAVSLEFTSNASNDFRVYQEWRGTSGVRGRESIDKRKRGLLPKLAIQLFYRQIENFVYTMLTRSGERGAGGVPEEVRSHGVLIRRMPKIAKSIHPCSLVVSDFPLNMTTYPHNTVEKILFAFHIYKDWAETKNHS